MGARTRALSIRSAQTSASFNRGTAFSMGGGEGVENTRVLVARELRRPLGEADSLPRGTDLRVRVGRQNPRELGKRRRRVGL